MKFVVYADSYEGGDRLFDEIKGIVNVDYIQPNNFMKVKFRFLNRVFRSFLCRCKNGRGIRLKRLIYNKCECGKFTSDDDVCFIYIEGWIKTIGTNGFTDYLKIKFPKSRHVLYYLDIHAARSHYKSIYKSAYDKVLIFDKTEADWMGIEFYPLPYSRVICNYTYSDINTADLYFVGQAKSRYKKLIEIFEFCKNKGIKTNFYILGVPKDNRLYEEEIHYVDFVPYEKTIEIAKKSNCGVELKVEGVDSYSQRITEAFMYGKKIISDNFHITEYKYYNKNRVLVFDNVYDLDSKFIKEPIHEEDFCDEIIAELSPKVFLDYLEKNI